HRQGTRAGLRPVRIDEVGRPSLPDAARSAPAYPPRRLRGQRRSGLALRPLWKAGEPRRAGPAARTRRSGYLRLVTSDLLEACTTSTGTGLECSTSCETLPSSAAVARLRPREPITIRSCSYSLAALTIASAGWPCSSSVVTGSSRGTFSTAS